MVKWPRDLLLPEGYLFKFSQDIPCTRTQRYCTTSIMCSDASRCRRERTTHILCTFPTGEQYLHKILLSALGMNFSRLAFSGQHNLLADLGRNTPEVWGYWNALYWSDGFLGIYVGRANYKLQFVTGILQCNAILINWHILMKWFYTNCKSFKKLLYNPTFGKHFFSDNFLRTTPWHLYPNFIL